MSGPMVRGVGRQEVGITGLDVFFDGPVSDDEMRRFHEFVRGFNRSPANSIVIHHIDPPRHPAPVVVMDGGRCRNCGALR